ncbi:hypothetical protein BKI52_34955 [marine bacterium AO1-C]|nr:hypothetical protein BKI52_34955 [marine bacterium AO1-C]
MTSSDNCLCDQPSSLKAGENFSDSTSANDIKYALALPGMPHQSGSVVMEIDLFWCQDDNIEKYKPLVHCL